MAKKNWQWKQNAAPTVTEEPKPAVAPKPFEPVKDQPTRKPENAGLQKIREAIKLIGSHSAASIGGSMLSEALILLEDGYKTLSADL